MTTKTYFTSDNHFGHANIIDYCDRPFGNVREMNYAMIARWNEVVGPRDTVYHLGDFAMGNKEDMPRILKRLNGRKILIRGNHDANTGKMLEAGFDEVLDSNVVVDVDGVAVWMNHYPVASEDQRDLRRPPAPGEYDVALCGHIHQTWRVKAGVCNVGVDVWNFYPISIEQIIAALAVGQ
jgi:calcineurin-like phosphoesterase family protein